MDACASVAALGHHIFYDSLDQTSASTATNNYTVLGSAGSAVTIQQANDAIGTSLAFLDKNSLMFAVSLAYLQAVSRNASRCSKKQTTIADMHVTMAALGNWLLLGKDST